MPAASTSRRRFGQLRTSLVLDTVLATLMLFVTGCGRTAGSLDPTSTPQTTVSADQIEAARLTDLKNQGGSDEEETGKLAVGDKAPDFEVEVLGGGSLRLSSNFGDAKGPTILLFDRAHW